MKMSNLALSAVALLLRFTTGTAVRVRLVGGPSPREGRLEVYYYSYSSYGWLPACNNYGYFNDAAASVVCYMLGYGHNGWLTGNRYGAGRGGFFLALR